MVDVSYVGNHGFNRLRAFQGGANGAVDLNAVDIGAAYLPQNQDPTLGPSAVPGASAYTSNLLRAYRGFGNINDQETRFWDTYHGIQMSVNRRFQNGLAFGTNYNLGSVAEGQYRLAAAHPARGRRHDLGAFGSGAVRGAEREPRAAASRDQELCGVGHPRAVAIGQRRQGGAQRLAAVRRAHRGLCVSAGCSPGQRRGASQQPDERPVRPHVHVPERRHEREPDGLPGLRGQDRLRRRSGVGLFGQSVRAVQHEGGHRTDLRQRRPRIGPQHLRRLSRSHRGHGDCQEHSVRRQPQRSSSASPCSTCSTPSSTTTATAT